MKKINLFAVAVSALLLLGSCTHRLTDFTVISTKNVPIGASHSEFKKGTTRVKGQHVAHTVLIIPLGTPNMKEAIDRAIEQTPGAIGLVDGVVKSSGWSCLFYGQNKYIVEGTPLFAVEEDERDNDEDVRPIVKSSSKHKSHVEVIEEQKEEPKETLVFYHEVKVGESLDDIAKAYNVALFDIIKWNKLNGNNIKKGDRLKILISE